MSRFLRKIFRLIKTRSSLTSEYNKYYNFLSTYKYSYSESYFNLTIDFELAWSRSRRDNTSTTLEESIERARRVREFTPILLELSEKYSIPVTYATVAHTALKDCSQHSEPPSFHPKWIKGDWYAVDPHTNISNNKDYYGADLFEKITNARIKNSVASHSFSHVDLGDSETTENIAKFEVEESYRILKKNYSSLRTYVFVKNHIAYKNILKNNGFTIYRNDKNHEIKYDEHGHAQFPLGLWISPEIYSFKDLVKLVDIAISEKKLVNFWCHLYEFKSSRQFRIFFEQLFFQIDLRQKTNMIKALTIDEIVSRVPIQSYE